VKKGRVHLAGQDPFYLHSKRSSVWRYLGCANPYSETAISVHKDSDTVTTDPAKVTCCHCRVKMQRGK